MTWLPSSRTLQTLGRVGEVFGDEVAQALAAWLLHQPEEPSAEGMVNYICLLAAQSVGGLQ